jgi:hypothetical protein
MRSQACLLLSLGLAVTAGSAEAFQFKRTEDGAPIRWGRVRLEVGLETPSFPAAMDPAATESAVQAAFATWTARVPSILSVDIMQAPLGVESPSDGRNLVRFVTQGWNPDYDDSSLAVTLVTYDPGSARIIDADLLVNAVRYEWSAGPMPASECAHREVYDVQDVITHEAGHFLGLAHEPRTPTAAMFPTAERCETSKRTLDIDDVRGVQSLYEGGAVSAPYNLDAAGTTGCSAGGRAGPGGLTLMLVALALAAGSRARRAWTRWLAGVGLAVVLGGTATATTARRLDLAELGKAAGMVVRGRVTDVIARIERDRVYTFATIQVNECWKGACPGQVVVRQLGGEAGGRGLSVEGMARFTRGTEIVAFLRDTEAASPARVVGMAQGLFFVSGEGTLTRDLGGLVLVRGSELARGGEETVTLRAVRQAATQR